MTYTVSQEAVDKLLTQLRKDMRLEKEKFEGVDLYKCGLADGGLEMLASLRLITPDQFDEVSSIGG